MHKKLEQLISQVKRPSGAVAIAAHRGDSNAYPENTLLAFRKAIEQDADLVELDVLLTADGEIVAMHDATAKRTTGVDRKLCEMTLAEVKQLDAGAWKGEAFRGEPVPTLAEALDVMKGKTIPLIEIKHDADYNPKLEARLVELLAQRGMAQQVLVQSFEMSVLNRLHQSCPSLSLAFLVGRDLRRAFHPLPASLLGLHPQQSIVMPDLVAEKQSRGKWVMPWTVNEPPRMRDLVSIGVDALITDVPSLAKTVVCSEASRTRDEAKCR